MKKSKTLLVICENHENYFQVFEGVRTIGDFPLVVDQASLREIHLSCYTTDLTKTGLVLDIYPSLKPFPNTSQERKRTIQPDFLLIRSVFHSIKGQYYKNLLYGFIYSGIPTLNSLESCLYFLERPLMHSQLLKIQKKIGKDNFPLIEQYYYSDFMQMNITPKYPIVLKVGHVHAGFGKMKLDKQNQFKDLASILALHKDYCTSEVFLNGEYDLRIQVIGSNVRVFKRTGVSDNWKTNTGTSMIEDVEVTKTYLSWVKEVRNLFDGKFEIFAIDVLHTEKGEEFILEVNDSSIGLNPNHSKEDLEEIKNLTLEKMKKEIGIDKDSIKSTEKNDSEVDLINLKNQVKDLTKENDALKRKGFNYLNYVLLFLLILLVSFYFNKKC